MRLLRLTVLLLLTTIVAFEPVVHSHPLLPENADGSGLKSPSVCAICAVGADRVVLSAAVLVAPIIVVEHLAAAPSRALTAEPSVPLASRAPPAA